MWEHGELNGERGEIKGWSKEAREGGGRKINGADMDVAG